MSRLRMLTKNFTPATASLSLLGVFMAFSPGFLMGQDRSATAPEVATLTGYSEQYVEHLRQRTLEARTAAYRAQPMPAAQHEAAARAVNEQDSLALVVLYNNTNGSNWRNNTNWLTGPVSTWFGVIVENDRVTHLELFENQLSGELPSALGDLSALIRLDLNDNQLTGPVTPRLGDLHELNFLGLDGNQLTGPIPLELSNLNMLEILGLARNQLTGDIPAELGNLTNLILLNLSANRLTGEIPPALGNLTNLEVLGLFENQLTGGIPFELSNLRALTFLSLERNQLAGPIPSWLGSLSNMTFLTLAVNQFTGEIPPALGSLSNLEQLWLYENRLTGGIPAELGDLTKLTFLELGGNQLAGEIPPSLGNLDALTGLGLWNNQLTGEIPSELGNLRALNFLNLSGNQLSGEIPVALSNLDALTELYLCCNQLTGEIPPALGNLNALTRLDLGDNQLTGDVPPALGNLTNLEMLRLGVNQLIGGVPSVLRNLTNLKDLWLLENQLVDLPDLHGLSVLEFLLVQGNHFTFEDIEPNIGVAATFEYAPQARVGAPLVLFVAEGENLPLIIHVGGEHNVYQWFKNDNPIPGATTDTYVISSATETDAGFYVLRITNSRVAALTLESNSILVNVIMAENQAPTASFTTDPTSGSAPLPVSFDASASSDPDGTIQGYAWVFGDGATGSGVTTSHTYPAPGTYTVTLTVTDDDGATAEVTETITVAESQNQAPMAAFTAVPMVGGPPRVISFDGSTSHDPDGTIERYAWDFGDGDTGSGVTTSHTYPAPGTYTVTLTVTDDDGATGTATETIVFYPATINYYVSHSFGSAAQQNSYRLVALPGNVDLALAATLSGQPGEDNDWRAFWDTGNAGSPDDYLVEYNGSAAFHFRPGRGFWLLSKQAWNISSSVATVPLAGDGSYAIDIHEGWNIISNPFDVDVPWVDVQAFNGTTQNLHRWQSNWNTSDTFASARDGEAFYFFNEDADRSALVIPYPGFAAIPEMAPVPRPAHVFTLSAYREGTLASSVRVGFVEEAAPGRNSLGQVAPPGHFEAASLRLVNTLSGPCREWASEYRPLGHGGEVFDLVLRAREATPVRLRAEGLETFAGMEVYLVDRHRSRYYNLREQPTLTLPASSNPRPLSLVIGTVAYVEGTKKEMLPERMVLSQNYPNPIARSAVIEYVLPASASGEEVRLEIFNMLGQRVRVLVDQPQAPGLYRVEWDATDDAGVQVASGAYLYRLRADSFVAVRRMLVLK